MNTVSQPEDVIVFAPMGGNPALLVTLAWKLWSERRWRVVSAYAPVLERGRMWAERELLAEGGALDELHGAVGTAVMPLEGLRVPVVSLPDGTPVADDDTAEALLAYQEAVLTYAKRAILEAADRRVVFALIGGRLRTITVSTVVVAQMLARRQDVIVDLRVRPAAALQPGAFLFPPQRERLFIGSDGVALDAREVEVQLVEVRLPRLGSMDPSLAFAPGYEALVSRGQAAIDEVASLRLEVVLSIAERGAFVTDLRTNLREQIPLSDTQLAYLASLCIGHEEGGGAEWLEVARPGQSDHPFARLCRERDWVTQLSAEAVEAFKVGTKLTGAQRKSLAAKTLPQLRSKTRAVLRAFASARDARYRALVPVPEKAGPHSRERLPLRNFVIRR